MVDSLPLLGGQLLKLLDGTHEMLTSSEGPTHELLPTGEGSHHDLLAKNVSVGRGLYSQAGTSSTIGILVNSLVKV